MPDRLRTLIAGNWKMNGLVADGRERASAVADHVRSTPPEANVDVLLCPPATLLADASAAIAGGPVMLGGQDCHPEEAGAFTGSISAEMLKDAGCSHVIVGHSERRHGLGEDNALIAAKAQAALKAGLTPIVCVGETQDERDAGRAQDVVGHQLDHSLVDVPGGALAVAYEPVWAIGTGRVPDDDDVGEIHGFIRGRLIDRLDDGKSTRILYGGSVKAANAHGIMTIPDVNGVLVGGASLDAEEFCRIIDAGGWSKRSGQVK